MKMKLKMIIILLFIGIIMLLCYIMWQKNRNISCIGIIDKIEDTTIVVHWQNEKNYCSISLKDIPIFDTKGNKIDISNLQIGDVVSVITRSDAVEFMGNPGSLSGVKKIKIIDE